MYKVSRTRKMLPVPGIWNGISQSDPETKKIHGASLKHVWTHCKDGEYTQINVDGEWRKAGEAVAARMRADRSYLPLVYKKQFVFGRGVVKLAKAVFNKNFSRASVSDLLTLYSRIQKAWLKFDKFNVPPWLFGGDFLHDYIYGQLRKIHPTINDEQLITLLTAPKKSFSAEEELDTVRLALKLKERSRINPSQRDLRALVGKYYWIPFGYDGPDTYDFGYYARVIKKLLYSNVRQLKRKVERLTNYKRGLQIKQEIIRKRFPIPSQLFRLIRYIRTLSAMTDQRKEFTFQAHIAFARVLEEIASRLEISAEALKFVTFEELVRYLNKPEQIAKIASSRKYGPVIYAAFLGKTRVVEGKEAVKLEKKLLPSYGNVSVLRGVVGSQGGRSKLRGKVRIILSSQEVGKLVSGEILVASMTTPEYVPAMRKSAAIITDEGGITSHATIVSRELGIPCIIGTKIATKVLKDGDIVEVDVDKGEIKKV